MMTEEKTIQTILERMKKETSGYWSFDPVKDKELIESISLPVRRALAKTHQLRVEHNNGTVPVGVKLIGLVMDDTKKVVSVKDIPKKLEEMRTLNASSHEAFMPDFTNEILSLFKCAKSWTTEKSVNIRKVGPKGSFKTESTYIEAKEAGFERVFHMNGYADMDVSAFLGEKTVKVDPKTMQNFIVWQPGMLELSMTHGLEKDENGHAVLDEKGNVKVIGAPAILFIDEYAAIPAAVSIVLNRVMEIPKGPGLSRRIELPSDDGRVVRSHPGWCITLSGNTRGKGLDSEHEQGYTAQDIQQDDSLLDRITATFEYGYNLDAEKHIMMNKLGDDMLVSKFIQFVEKARKCYCEGTFQTLMSTRNVVSVCDVIRIYKNEKHEDPVGKALFRTLFSGLYDSEKPRWNEQINLIFGVDIMNKYHNKSKLWKPTIKR